MTTMPFCARVLALLVTTSTALAQAQAEPPPLPPLEAPPPSLPPDQAPSPPSTPVDAPAVERRPGVGAGSSATAPQAAPPKTEESARREAPAEGSETGGEARAVTARKRVSTKAKRNSGAYDGAFLTRANTLDGPTGLLRIVSADSGEPGTLRVSLTTNFFWANGFLCPSCSTPNGTVSTAADDAAVSAQRFQLSATPFDFLEVYGALRYQQTSNSVGTPRVLQISGNPSIGAKAFIPKSSGRILTAGGGAAVELLSDDDGMGTPAANVLVHFEGTLDLTRQREESYIPLRAHFNVGYLFDSSDAVISDIEQERSTALGSTQRITRVERFAFDINRVDSLRLGLGIEGGSSYVTPFIEWTVDAPVNRQGYLCRLGALGADDNCLSRAAGFESTPSRATIGVRAHPWFSKNSHGVALLAALDIGTGGTSVFLDEVAPELPWSLHFGAGYAFDTRPIVKRVTTQKTVRVIVRPSPTQHVEGTVVDAANGTPVARAAVFFKEADTQGMLTDSEGHFRTLDLKPGSHVFLVRKDGYRDGECMARIIGRGPTARTASPTADAPRQAPVSEATPVECKLEALPQKGRVEGLIRDADTAQPVRGANVRISDSRGRSLTLQTDGLGGFRFENVPVGTVRLQVDSPDYLPAAAEIELKARDSLSVQLAVHERPQQPNVIRTPTELKLRDQLRFFDNSAKLRPDSLALVAEIAEVLRSTPELSVEIQVHASDTTAPDQSQALSERRADAIRKALMLLGVDPDRLRARGYGQDRPLVPNTSAANRAKNQRVQLMIL